MNNSGAKQGDAFDAQKEIVRLIEADHDQTTDFISRLIALRGAVRGIAVSLGSALAGLALANDTWPVAIAGVPIVLIAAAAEAHSDLMRDIAHKRSVLLERKVQAYVASLRETGVVALDAKANLERELDTYEYGTSRSIRRSSLAKALGLAWRKAAFWLYPAMAAVLTVIAISLWVSDSNPTEAAGVCVSSPSGTVHLAEAPEVLSGELSLVPCPQS